MRYLKSLAAILLALLFVADASAETTTYVEPGAYNVSAKRWSRAINSSNISADTWIWNQEGLDRRHKNGRRDSILSIPESAAPEDITLVIWFHGLGGFSEKGFKKRIIPQMEDLADTNTSFAIAIPEMPWSTNTTTPRGRQGRVWLGSGELQRYVESTKERLEDWARLRHGQAIGTVRIAFVGHSAGGSAIMSASKEGSLCSVNPEYIVWSDASYGSWLDRAWQGCMKSLDSSVELHILVRKWDTPHKNAERIIKSIRRHKSGPRLFYQVMDRKLWTHGSIGNNVFVITNIFPPGC